MRTIRTFTARGAGILTLAILLAACRGNAAPTTNPVSPSPLNAGPTAALGASAPETTAEGGSNPQQQPGSAIGALPNATNAGASSSSAGQATVAATGDAGTAGGSSGSNTTTNGSANGTANATTNGTANGTASANANTSANAGTVATMAANGATNTQGGIDPCSLVSAADIQTAINTPVEAGIRGTDEMGGVSCQFQGQGAAKSTSVGITIYEGVSDAKALQDKIKQANGQAVTGLGDEAYTVKNGVFVHSGTRWVSVGVAVGSDSSVQTQNVAMDLARKILDKLKQGGLF